MSTRRWVALVLSCTTGSLLVTEAYGHEIRRGERCLGETVFFGRVDPSGVDPGEPAPGGTRRVAVKAGDGVVLHGLRLPGETGGEIEGCVLIAPGDAMRADAYLEMFTPLAELGLNLYLFDYRGFGRNEDAGRPGFADHVVDLREVLDWLDGRCTRTFVYGISYGGYVASNAVHDIAGWDAIVLDSTPSRVPRVVCPLGGRFDPVELLPAEAWRLMILYGKQDKNVLPAQIEDLLRTAFEADASVFQGPSIGHPFLCHPGSCDEGERFDAIELFLTHVDARLDREPQGKAR